MNAQPSVSTRRVFCLLGLPFDALSMSEAEARIRDGVAAAERGFLSTPNLNWVALAQRSPVLRHSVLASSCSLVDGMPLAWLAKLLRLPCPGRVSGSDLMERLQAAHTPLRVYFFGGMGDVAARAAQRLENSRGGLRAVGSLNPGSGSVIDMSADSFIADINAAQPDLVVVSLGAQKGQEWILHNRERLNAAWISHLGAVVNFFAGEVRRAPKWLARIGLEWLWRIIQEPGLWRRYWADSLTVGHLLLFRMGPNLLRARLARPGRATSATSATSSVEATPDGRLLLCLAGDWVDADALRIPRLIETKSDTTSEVRVDLAAVSRLGNEVIAQLMIGQGLLSRQGVGLSIVRTSPVALFSLRAHCAEFLLGGNT